MTRAKHGLFGTLATVMALVACSGALPPSLPVGNGPPVSASVFSAGYGRIAEAYLEPTEMSDLALNGLKGLSKLDPRLDARRDPGFIELAYDGAPIGTIPTPHSQNPREWASVTLAALSRGQQVSQPLRDATADQLYEAVFAGITSNLDPYSRYATPDQAKDERAFRDGYGGIGLMLSTDDRERPTIQEVFPDGPAFRAGVQPNSVILAVDGVPVGTMAPEELGSKLRGAVGSRVSLTVAPPAGGERTFLLRRERVIPNAVRTRYDDGFAVIEVSRFNVSTAENLEEVTRQAVAKLGPSGKGIILDLRGNPGGLLTEAVAVADMFIPDGLIISTRGRHPESIQYFDAGPDDLANGLPMVVLVDGQSASGAEVVAAALQDTGRAVVVGASSYGKGSVQTVSRLPNDGELFLTWSRIYTPAGYTLHQQGVMPTICTSAGIEDPEQLVTMFRSGELPVPARMMSDRRAAPDDPVALAHLREACPWKEHDGAVDIEVAELLLSDRSLYAEALAITAPPVIAHAERLDTAN